MTDQRAEALEGSEPQASDAASDRSSGTQLRSEPPLASGSPCARCKVPLEGEYVELNGRATCLRCRAKLEGNVFVASAVALLAGVGCAALYYLVWELWAVRFSLVAVLAGVLVGNAVRRFAGLRSRPFGPWIAVVITYLSVVATYLHSVVLEADGATTWAVLRASLLLPFGMVYEGRNIVTLVLLAFGLHEAWQFSKLPPVHIAGPFRVADE